MSVHFIASPARVKGKRLLLRVLTYNVHRCLGSDGKTSPPRIAEVIASCEPDIVALQELDIRRSRSGHVDQAHAIALELRMQHVHFNAAFRVLEEEYGDAILTTRPSKLVKAGALPGLPHRPFLERRGALQAAIQLETGTLQVVNTHLGLRYREKVAQVGALLGPEWIGSIEPGEPLVLLGDFNSVPHSRIYRALTAKLRDARVAPPAREARGATFPARYPLLRIDYVFVGSPIEVLAVETVRTRLSRVASDHLPVLAEIGIRQHSEA